MIYLNLLLAIGFKAESVESTVFNNRWLNNSEDDGEER